MGYFNVDPDQLSSAGASIEAAASQLGPVVSSVAGIGAVAQPPKTAAALDSLQSQWSAGAQRLREDVELLGRGGQASATLYKETDANAMGPP